MAKFFFTVDARAVVALGRESIKDHTTAIVELIKNSYDADASTVELEMVASAGPTTNYIRIADDGYGMNAADVENYWLRIGFSSKRIDKVTASARRKTGEKGIGRLSSDRLGEILELRTKRDGSKPVGLEIDWKKFEGQGKDLSSIPLESLDEPSPTFPRRAQEARSGTELVIRGLRQEWTESDVQELREELAILTPPFKGAQQPFRIFLKNDINKDLNGPIESAFIDRAEIEFSGRLDRKGNLKYQMRGRVANGKSRMLVDDSMPWKHLIQASSKAAVLSPQLLGPIRLRFLFYPRRADLLEGTTFSLSDLRQFLDRNAGIRIYRDGIRVKPYGDPGHAEGDWLALAERKTRSPAGPARDDFRFGANQLIGIVEIGRDTNANLADSSSREGLVHGDAYRALKAASLGCILLMEAQYHKVFQEKDALKQTKETTAKAAVSELKGELNTLAQNLTRVRDEISSSSSTRHISKSIDQIETALESIEKTAKSITELASQTTVYRGLATVGIAAAVFGHETQSSLSGALLALTAAKGLLTRKTPRVDRALKEILKAQEHSDKIGAWGRFALLRVKRDKRQRRKTSIDLLIKSLLTELGPAFESSGVQVDVQISPVMARVFPMDVEAAAVNLLTNAYSACQQVSKDRTIRVVVAERQIGDRAGFAIEVADSGPGIAKQYIDRVWEPLFSTKVDKKGNSVGTGLGLTIVRSVAHEMGGTTSVIGKSDLGGASFTVWIPN